jgi:predicted HicB family RNase H-like nuclease
MAYAGYNDARKRANEKYLAKLDKILLRVTPEEKKEIEKRANQENKSVNQYLKDKALKD